MNIRKYERKLRSKKWTGTVAELEEHLVYLKAKLLDANLERFNMSQAIAYHTRELRKEKRRVREAIRKVTKTVKADTKE